MSILRRRYYSWLLKAYLKRWYKVILASVIIGAGIFFFFFALLNFYLFPILENKIAMIGYAGSYAANELPEEILNDISYGLTKVNKDGTITPAAAYAWEIKNDGKSYTFYLKKGQKFHNGRELTSSTFNFNFQDVEKKIIDEYTVELVLKEPYSPFLSSLSAPIFDENLAGLGEYRVSGIDINAGFVKSIVLENREDAGIKKKIYFYPTDSAVKTAYALGEIDKITDTSSLSVGEIDLSIWGNTNIEKGIKEDRLIALFYNNDNDTLSNKKIRQALNYAIPEEFEEGQRAFSPIRPTSIYFSESPNYGISDVSIAKELLDGENGAYDEKYVISTTSPYVDIANKVAESWQKLGLDVEVVIIGGLHENFQILLYPINLPKDPDQYTLWHSSQGNNIARYKSLRIDKLLEDGRSSTNEDDRLSIYADFQKYLIDDVPASFLYFPYSYSVSRN